MAKNRNNNEDKERVVNFALLIQQIIDAKGLRYHIESQNQGIADADIILIIETWLEKVKENFQKPIRDSIRFGKSSNNENQDKEKK